MVLPVLIGLGRTVIGTTTGRVVLLAVALFTAWQVDRAIQRQRGAAAVVEQSIETGREINDQNQKVRSAARRPGAADRLLRKYCRDCDGGM